MYLTSCLSIRSYITTRLQGENRSGKHNSWSIIGPERREHQRGTQSHRGRKKVAEDLSSSLRIWILFCYTYILQRDGISVINSIHNRSSGGKLLALTVVVVVVAMVVRIVDTILSYIIDNPLNQYAPVA